MRSRSTTGLVRRSHAVRCPPLARRRARPDLARPLLGGRPGRRRATTARSDFIDARRELDGPGDAGDRVIERVDPAWLDAIARLADHDVDAIAGRWVDLVEEELGFLPREEKPWIRKLAGDIVAFARDSRPLVRRPLRLVAVTDDRAPAGPRPDADPYIAENRVLWDEWTAIHETSAFYDLDGFRAGGIRIRPYELEDIGPDGTWRLPGELDGRLPLFFSLLATKPGPKPG